MKTRRNLLTFLGLFMTLSIIAQTPGVNYQAVLRDQAGHPMPGENVGLIISLIDDITGDLIYKERHDLTTNDLGMLNTLIGTGTVEEGIFEEIIGIQDLSLQLQAAIPGEPDIVDIGSSKVGGVPFALYGEDADADPDNELQSISSDGDSLKISEMGGVELNAINYWEKTDTGFVLDLQTTARSALSRYYFHNQLCKLGVVDDEKDLASAFGADYLEFKRGQEDIKLLLSAAKVELSDRQGENVMAGTYEEDDYCGFRVNYRDHGYSPALNLGFNFMNGSSFFHTSSHREDGMCVRNDASDQAASSIVYGGPNIFGGIISNEQESSAMLATAEERVVISSQGLSTFVENSARNVPVLTTFKGTNSDNAGSATFNGPSSTNLQITSLANNPNNGYLLLLNAQNENKAGIYIDEAGEGIVYGSNVLARVASGPEAEYIYGSLVGDESAAYTRGTATLVDGVAIVICPEHFQAIADPNSMTVTITPLSAESKGIAVVEKFPGGFRVQELNGGKGAYSFDYSVSCKRKGMEEYKVEHKLPTANTMDLSKISSIKMDIAER